MVIKHIKENLVEVGDILQLKSEDDWIKSYYTVQNLIQSTKSGWGWYADYYLRKYDNNLFVVLEIGEEETRKFYKIFLLQSKKILFVKVSDINGRFSKRQTLSEIV